MLFSLVSKCEHAKSNTTLGTRKQGVAGRSATAAVEFAVILPFVMVLFLGIIEAFNAEPCAHRPPISVPPSAHRSSMIRDKHRGTESATTPDECGFPYLSTMRHGF